MIQDNARTDAQLLSAWIHHQDSESFEQLIERYAPLVFRVCRRQCRSLSDAEDAFQVTMMILARSAHSIKSSRALPAWLHGTAYRVSARSRRMHFHEQNAPSDSQEVMSSVAHPDDSGPLDAISRQHELCVLDEELHRIPETVRSPLIMHYLEGMQLADVAQRLGTTLGAIRGRLQRGRQELRQRLILRGVSLSTAFTLVHDALNQPTLAAQWVATTQNRMLENPDLYTANPLASQPLLTASSPVTNGLMMKSSLLVALAAVPFVLTMAPSGTPYSHAAPQQPPTETTIVQQGAASPGEGQYAGTATIPPTTAPASRTSAEDDPFGGPSDVPKKEPSPQQAGYDPNVYSSFDQYLKEVLKQPISLNVRENTPLLELAPILRRILGVPIVLDLHGGLKLPSDASVSITSDRLPISATLKEALQPHGLTVTVRDEAITILPDHNALARREINTARYINISDEYMQQVAEIIDKPLPEALDFNAIPLSQLINALNDQFNGTGIRLSIDTASLEDIGLSVDMPVTLKANDVSLYELINFLRDEYQLALLPASGHLRISTVDALQDPQKMLRRIYWLDATGLKALKAMEVIQTAIVPDTWEQLGGPSSIVELESAQGRSAIVVSTSYAIHREIETLLRSFREVNQDPTDYFEYTPPTPVVGGQGGMGGGMGGGMF
jgi:RNA polymerase sigma factor (sigma-70 family)